MRKMVKASSPTLTLDKMQELFEAAKKEQEIQEKCSICDRKAVYYYFQDASFVGGACEKHK